MKPVCFLGDSLRAIQEFPPEGKGVEEIRIWDRSGTFRVIYTARIESAVYVLRDVDRARARFAQIGDIKS